MILQHDGVVSKRRTGYLERITTVSCLNKEVAASFVSELLMRLDPADSLQLTIATKRDGSVDCSVMVATTSSSDTSLKIA